VLAGILINADAEGSITLSAFDYEVSARITVAADVQDAGTVLVWGAC
jgi:DNA polymerase-3 subunit beta